MKITVTFTGPGNLDVPDGASLVFDDVDSLSVSTPAEVEQVACGEAGCGGCSAVHRKFTGVTHLELSAAGSRDGGPRWVIPKAGPEPAVHACPFDGEQVTPCCHRTPFGLPRGDKITIDHKIVTCRGDV